MAHRDVRSLPIKPEVAEHLVAAGFVDTSDLMNITAARLQKELNGTILMEKDRLKSGGGSLPRMISLEDCSDVLKVVRDLFSNAKRPRTAGNDVDGGDSRINSNLDGSLASNLAIAGGTDSVTSSQSQLRNSTQPSNNQVTAKDLFRTAEKDRPIITFCRSLDGILGGGIPIGQITEIYGQPGMGKTQICMQLCVNVQIPDTFGGCGGEAIFIDTEGNLTPERLSDMATYMSSHLLQIFELKNKDPSKKYAKPLTRDSFLSGIYVYRVHDQGELLAVIMQLDKIIAQNSKIKLVIVDSIAFPFRLDFQNNSHVRSRTLSQIAQHLYKVAFDHRVAIVTSNHTTVRFGDRSSSGGVDQIESGSQFQRVVPALGEQWSHCVTNRIYLHYDDENQRRSLSGVDFDDAIDDAVPVSPRRRSRVATLVKSPSLPLNSANYQILSAGIKDISVASESSKK